MPLSEYFYQPEEVHVKDGGRHEHGENIEEGHDEDAGETRALHPQEVVVELAGVRHRDGGIILVPLEYKHTQWFTS